MTEVLLQSMLRASVHGAVLAAVVWLLCRAVPTMPSAARALLWWTVALKLVVGLVWLDAVQVPVLPAPAGGPALAVSATVPVAERATPAVTVRHAEAALPQGASAGQRAVSWLPGAIVSAWLVGVVVLGVALVARVRRTRATVARADPVARDMHAAVRDMAWRVGVSVPRVLRSREIDTPQVTGVVRPVVLLPAGPFERLSAAAQEMALCHELVHLRRRDLWLGLVPAIAERLFFFHPLAHLAAREYLVAREAACDAEVLRLLDADPRDYGHLLLSLGVSRSRAGLAAAGASRSPSTLRRRLMMLDRSTAPAYVRRLAWTAVAVAGCALVPLQLVARQNPAAPRHASTIPHATGTVAPSVPAPPPAHAVRQEADARSAPPAHASAHAGTPRGRERDFEWMILGADDRTMSGSAEDRARVKRLQRGSEPLLWVRRDGREHVIRDAATIARAKALFAPVEAIGKRMGEIGAKQGEIGRRQGEVGAKMGAVGARQGELGARQAALATRQAALALQQDRGDREPGEADAQAAEKALEAEMKALGEQMDALGKEMEALGKPMEDLGREMEPLGKQQESLGREIEAAVATAEAQLKALVEQAIASGAAEDVR